MPKCPKCKGELTELYDNKLHCINCNTTCYQKTLQWQSTQDEELDLYDTISATDDDNHQPTYKTVSNQSNDFDRPIPTVSPVRKVVTSRNYDDDEPMEEDSAKKTTSADYEVRPELTVSDYYPISNDDAYVEDTNPTPSSSSINRAVETAPKIQSHKSPHKKTKTKHKDKIKKDYKLHHPFLYLCSWLTGPFGIIFLIAWIIKCRSEKLSIRKGMYICFLVYSITPLICVLIVRYALLI